MQVLLTSASTLPRSLPQDSDEVLASPVLGPLAREAVARLDPGDRPEVKF